MGNNDLLFTEILEVEFFFFKGKVIKTVVNNLHK